MEVTASQLPASAPAPASVAGDGAVSAVGAVPPVEAILERVNPPLSPEFEGYIRRAYEIGLEAHRGQLRKSGEPYYVHCVEVSMLLAEIVGDWATIAAGLLHDTIEDCGFTVERIRSLLPDPVAELVDGVTKISKIHFGSDREHQAENLRKMILAMARDVRVVLVKLCDRLHNMRTLRHLAPEKQREVAQATIEIFAPLAKRLGMERICRELEDLTLEYTHPIIFRRLQEHIERNRERYGSIIERTRQILEDTMRKKHIPARVSGRLKHTYSIYRKMLKGGLDLDEIHDLMAIRVVVENVPRCYEALGLVHQRWKPVPGRFKDYIATPKANGYQSIHTTVMGVDGEMTEIQIRTGDMHRLADEGIASHWKYKEAGSGEAANPREMEKLAWLRQLLDWLTDIRDPNEFMAAVKKDVFEASVFCYTPRGDVIEMPAGSTVLDFAYRIHSELGTHCSGARVNHKMTSIRTTLHTGDIVEILSSKAAHPTPDWLQIAQSSRTRNKIRHWLKSHRADEYLERGRRAFLEAVLERDSDASTAQALQRLPEAAEAFSLSSADDLLIEIGFGSIKAGAVVSRLMPTPPPPRKRVSRAQRREKPDTVVVDGLPGAVTRLAKCCVPTPGTPIVGFVTQGRGISVHAASCRAFHRILDTKDDPYGRIIGVRWGDETDRHLDVVVRVVCQDRKGLLNDVTQAVSRLGVNITEARTKSNALTSQAILRLTVQVPDEASLNMLLNRIEGVPSVRSVSRVILGSGATAED